MRKLSLNLKPRPYTIYIGKNIIAAALKEAGRELKKRKMVLVTNTTVMRLHKERLKRALHKFKPEIIALPDTEKIKSFPYLLKVINKLCRFGYKQAPFLAAAGGGVVGDLTGFAASIYKRGIPYLQIPTTLLAQVDASIGGKTAIDIEAGKNLVGSFWQPYAVLSDTAFLNTLETSQVKEGLAEIIKYALISDTSLLKALESKAAGILAKESGILEEIVYRCARIKARIVEKDEKETQGLRTILNFGHTFAHALEAASRYQISHGQAVACGIIAALRLSEARLGLDPRLRQRVQALMAKLGIQFLLKAKGAFWKKAMRHMEYDKKFTRRANRLVLLHKAGKPAVAEGIRPQEIERSLESIKA